MEFHVTDEDLKGISESEDKLVFFANVSARVSEIEDERKRIRLENNRSFSGEPRLPQAFVDKIREISNGAASEEERLVIEKTLFATDVSHIHNRVSIPVRKVKNSFLTEEESNFLRGKNGKGKPKFLDVIVIEPSLEQTEAKLSNWNSCYVIKGTWKKIVRKNGLKSGTVLQFWAFRVQNQLGIAIVERI
ncbi:B3 domain-containing protein At1g05920-like [Andrographis paniculata]|uniref:B3 domain-containing protein At1g05920-like n=1 Tax=Andrographis paniculata TaxID=175694 RepID=UPI0021E94F35|nr:B3 domain-containing protein At1g05920-like [Andrographis paniculata]